MRLVDKELETGPAGSAANPNGPDSEPGSTRTSAHRPEADTRRHRNHAVSLPSRPPSTPTSWSRPAPRRQGGAPYWPSLNGVSSGRWLSSAGQACTARGSRPGQGSSEATAERLVRPGRGSRCLGVSSRGCRLSGQGRGVGQRPAAGVAGSAEKVWGGRWSGGPWRWRLCLEGTVVAQQGPQHVDAASRQGDQKLTVRGRDASRRVVRTGHPSTPCITSVTARISTTTNPHHHT
jgi:hypothetical protein